MPFLVFAKSTFPIEEPVKNGSPFLPADANTALSSSSVGNPGSSHSFRSAMITKMLESDREVAHP